MLHLTHMKLVINTQSPTDKAFSPSVYIRGVNTPHCAMYLITKTQFVIGKDTDCDAVAYFSNEISHKHARIAWHDEQYWITDLESTNGTCVNGKRLVPNTEHKLSVGDRIKISSFVFVVEQINQGEKQQ